jgi:predicted amidohydrolase YtcJ
MPADRVFLNGRVFTADPALPEVTAVAVSGDRVVAVGSSDTVREHVGRATELVDLGGRLLTPGFIDAHLHPGTSGLDKLRVDLEQAFDAASAVEAVARYAAEHPDLPWILGSGWSQAWFPRGCPEREVLDRAVPDRPVLLWNSDGHSAWVNGIALAMAGVDDSTPDPPDGRIERDQDGSPQGTMHEGAVTLVERHAPEDTVEDFVAGLLRGQQEMLSYGITGWQDAHVGRKLQAAYLDLAGSARLKCRVVAAMWWDHEEGLDQIESFVERRRDAGPRLRPTSVKLMLDGVAESFTASMLDPYLGPDGASTGNRGIAFIDPRRLGEIVTRLDALDFQCHFHAIGDRAVRDALDAIEAALAANGPRDNRHHIAHLQVVHPDDLPRFASLGVVANAQPLWAHHDVYQDELTIPFLGPERSSWQYPFGSLLRAGARMAMGSDWAVSTADVMQQIHMAVNRAEGGVEPFYPEEAITPEEALTAFTAGSAYVNHAETDTGTLRPGMLADLVVVDRDPLADGSFAETKVDLTMIGGEVVYRAG